VAVALAAAAISCNGCNSTPEPNNPSPPSVTVPAQTAETSPDALPDGAAAPDCVTGGCSGELCHEPGTQAPTFTNCEYKREYECYKSAVCGRDANGQCGWQSTPELSKCLNVSR
jgi:eight-cysteine-cluster-containing protein